MRKRKEQPPYEQSPAPRLLTVMQVAAVLGVGKDTVYGLIKNEGLPAVSVGLVGTRQKLRVSVTSLDRWIREREQIFTGRTSIPTNVQTDVKTPQRTRRARKGLAESAGESYHCPPNNALLGHRSAFLSSSQQLILCQRGISLRGWQRNTPDRNEADEERTRDS